MTKTLTIVLFAELLLAIFLGQWGFMHSRESNRAVFIWITTRTPESRIELDRQKRINQYYRLGTSAVFFGAMAGLTMVVVSIASGPRLGEPQGSAGAPAARDDSADRP